MIPSTPDKEEVLRLLNKLHEKDIPNWNTKDNISAYKQLQSLTFNWFRIEVPNIRNDIPK